MRRLLFILPIALLVASCSGAEPAKPPVDPVAKALAGGGQVVVQVGADWCGPCHDVDTLYGPVLRQRGVFVHLDLDRDRWVCERWRLAPPIPRVIVYPPRPPVAPFVRVPHVYVGVGGIKVFVEGHRP